MHAPEDDAGRRVVLVTGAGGTLGSALCAALRPTADLVAVHRSAPPPVPSQRQHWVDPLEPGSELPENAHRVFAVRADLATEGAVERVVEIALAHFGRIDAVVNAIGRPAPGSTLASKAALDGALTVFAVNAVIPARVAATVAREFWRHRPRENRLRNRGVVHVGHHAGLDEHRGSPAVLSASKAALHALARHQAEEFAAIGVRVNAVAPLAFPARVSVASVVDAVRWVDDSDLTGAVVVIDGAGRRTT
jgi:NAD(P)-dependent dehydrogenase (short-subunit alcohol dehydrogenase family)